MGKTTGITWAVTWQAHFKEKRGVCTGTVVCNLVCCKTNCVHLVKPIVLKHSCDTHTTPWSFIHARMTSPLYPQQHRRTGGGKHGVHIDGHEYKLPGMVVVYNHTEMPKLTTQSHAQTHACNGWKRYHTMETPLQNHCPLLTLVCVQVGKE